MSTPAAQINGRVIYFHEMELIARTLCGEVGVHGHKNIGWTEPKSEVHGLAVLQCMLQRFAVVGRWETLSDLLMAYCQPVNPRWARGGDLERKRRASLKTLAALRTHEKHVKRREALAKLHWEDFDRGLRHLVAMELVWPSIPVVPAAVHFAAKGASRLQKGWQRVPVVGLSAGDHANEFFSITKSRAMLSSGAPLSLSVVSTLT